MLDQQEETKSHRLKIVVLEDDSLYRRGILQDLAIHGDLEVVGASRHPIEILEFVKKSHPDIAFIDLRISDDDKVGVNTIREIKVLDPKVKCIVFTAYPFLSNFVSAFRAGAEAFIRKEGERSPGYFGEIAKSVAAGARFYPDELVEDMRTHLKDSIVANIGEVGIGEKSLLTGREQEVLELLQKGFHNKEIADKLSISINTAKQHVKSVMSKLGADDRHLAVYIALSKGLLQREHDEEE